MINITKRKEAPQSLAKEKAKANGSYREEDVVLALYEDSHNKCYLCEDTLLTTINVEHFHEHGGDKDLKFDWNNLHYACGHCNYTKNDTFKKRDSNLLNCANPECLVDYWIIYRLEEDDKLVAHAVINQNPMADVSMYQKETDNTILLLDRIYNVTGTAIRNREAANLLTRVQLEIINFKENLLSYLSASDGLSKQDYKTKLGKAIADSSPFAAFKRWILRDNGLASEFNLSPE